MQTQCMVQFLDLAYIIFHIFPMVIKWMSFSAYIILSGSDVSFMWYTLSSWTEGTSDFYKCR